jgi:hypothetical protein
MLFRYLLIVVAMGLCASAGAQEIDVTLSNSSALFRYIHDVNSDFGQTETDAGLLYTDSNDVLVMFGIQAKGEAGSGSPGLNAGVGVKGFTANTDAYDLLALAIGGELHYSLPSINRLGFRAQVFHAPGIVSFVDADDFTYLALSVEYEVLQQATAYVGYRSVKSGLRGQGTVTIDNDTHIGLRINF